jgi:hypothetical protein
MLVERGHGVDHEDCLLGRPRPGRQQTLWLPLRHERERADRPGGRVSRWTSCGSARARGDEATASRGEAAAADRGL